MIQLDDEQRDAVRAIRGLARGDVLIVRGYAGVGKSTVISHVVKRGGVAAVMTPTGKAAVRLRELGAPARTLHSVLFRAKDSGKAGSELEWEASEYVPLEAGDLVVVDEASMLTPLVARRLDDLVERLRLRLVLVGDGYQLPPILGPAEEEEYPGGFSVLEGDGFDDADLVELTTVHRTALDSPITAAATRLRQGEPATPDPGQDVYRAPVGRLRGVANLMTERYQAGEDAVAIVWRNVDRRQLNEGVRRRLGLHGALPERGEPLMVLANSYGRGLMNGEVVRFNGYAWGSDPWPLTAWNEEEPLAIRANVDAGRGDIPVAMVVDFLGGETDLRPGDLYRKRMGVPEVHRNTMLCVDFGYAATAHKAQGSQWSHAIVHVPTEITRWPDHRRWVYTAMTRACDRLTVIRGRGLAPLFGRVAA